MYIVVTAYVLCNRYDITKGGTAVPVSLVRVGRMVESKKNTYKCVYNDDGTYTYPRIKEHLLHKKGQEYFKPKTITG